MNRFKKIIKKILRRVIRNLKQEEKKKINGIPMLSDKKLISIIGMEMHSFYYPEKSKVRDLNYIKRLLSEAERRSLLNFENVKGAKTFLKRFNQDKITDKNRFTSPKPTNYFFELAKKRQSIRKFSDKKIPKVKIYKILKCAIEAPSSCNRQAWRFLILDDKNSLSFISEIRRIQFLREAPTVICVFVDKDLYGNEKELNYTVYMDGSAAIMNMLYAAESLGISSCWVNFGGLEISKNNMERFYKFFKIEYNFKPISLIALGYGDQNVKKPKRELIKYYILGEN